jgi:hypothetical protein
MKTLILIVLVCSTGYLYTQNKGLEVEGGIKIGNYLSVPEPGILRWTGADFEGWNGSTWLSLTLDSGPWQVSGPNIYYANGKVGIGTQTFDPEALLHIKLPNSNNFAHLNLESPSHQVGFGIKFINPSMFWNVGMNVDNWNDNRFQIAPDGSTHWLTILPNGNVGLTKTGFTTPLARLQVPQNGDINDGGILNVFQSAIYIGTNTNEGIAMDRNQIEMVGNDLKINELSNQDIVLANGGGMVGISVGSGGANAPLHVGEGKTIVFGADSLGKANFYPDPKLLFLPSKGGAFRVGQLNADGSIIGGTGYNFWDPAKVGWASIAIGNNTRATGAGSVALGIRSDADNFGAVALGHLSRARGNSAVAAGYYTRADAFVGTAVGAGNVGGGSANSWNATDPIFEVGNSIDTSNRSNAFTVMKNGRVGINHHNPQSMLDIEQPNQGPGNGVLLNLAGVGHWEIGIDNAKDYNFYFNNGLKAYILDTDGSYIKTSDAKIKTDIKSLDPVLSKILKLKPSTYLRSQNTTRSLGFIAQQVEPLFPELVSEKNELKGLNYDGFGVIAIKAIQEQQYLINQQQKLIEELVNRVQKLEEQE